MAQAGEGGMDDFAFITGDALTEEFGEKLLDCLKSLTVAFRSPDFRYWPKTHNKNVCFTSLTTSVSDAGGVG